MFKASRSQAMKCPQNHSPKEERFEVIKMFLSCGSLNKGSYVNITLFLTCFMPLGSANEEKLEAVGQGPEESMSTRKREALWSYRCILRCVCRIKCD